MCIIFLMGLSTSGIKAKWVAHELDQHFYALGSPAATDTSVHEVDLIYGADALDEVEHQLLHAVSHIEPLLLNDAFENISSLQPHVTQLLAPTFEVCSISTAPPLRPPRTYFPNLTTA